MNTISSSRQRATNQNCSSNDLQSLEAAGRRKSLWLLLAVSLISVVLCLPFVRYIWWLGDEGVLLHGAERMLQGDKLYLDFFEFLPPGGFIITEAWFAIAGMSIFSAHTLAILTIGAIACFTYLACRQASKHAPLSAFIAVGWVVISQGLWTEINHHWFTTLFSMIAAWATLVSIERAQPSLLGPLVAGVAAGAAAMVIPTRGAFATLAAATAFLNLRRHRAEAVSFVLGCTLVPICTFGYLIAHGALTEAFDDVILFAATRYASIQSVPFGSGAHFHLRWIFPFGVLITVLACVRDRHECLYNRVFRTCAAFGFAGFAGCFPRPDWVHIGFAAPLVCPLLAYCANRLIRPWPARYQYAAAALGMASLIPPAHRLWSMSQSALRGEVVSTPRGRVTLVPSGAWELAQRIAATPADDAYFFYPYMPMLPFLTARRQVSKYDVFTPGYTLPSQYKEACVSAMGSASWVVIDRVWTDPKALTAVFPGMRDPEPRETRRFEQALEKGFELVARQGAFEMRRRVPAVGESVCAGIAE
jgi:hypothetical protein